MATLNITMVTSFRNSAINLVANTSIILRCANGKAKEIRAKQNDLDLQ